MNKFFKFDDYKLNYAQTHETAHQLYHTIEEFSHSNPFIEFGKDNKHHLIGKLKFFIDLYVETAMHLHINETVVIDNYYAFLKQVAQGYTDDDLSDAYNDYKNWIIKIINDPLDNMDENHITDIDEVINHIQGYEFLNFQEQQLILDCYYSTLADYKIMRKTENGYEDEVYYHDTRFMIAIDDYLNRYNCDHTDLQIVRVYKDDEYYTEKEFYCYLRQHNIDADFVIGFDDVKTIKEWIQYIILTLVEVIDDLKKLDNTEEEIQANQELIEQLKSLQ